MARKTKSQKAITEPENPTNVMEAPKEVPLEESAADVENSTQDGDSSPLEDDAPAQIMGFPIIIPFFPGTPIEALQMAIYAWRKFFLERHEIFVIGNLPEGISLEAKVIPFSDYTPSPQLTTLKMILTFVSEHPEAPHFILSPATTFCLHPSGIEDVQLPKCALQDKEKIVFETGLPIYFRTEALLSLCQELAQNENPDFISNYYMKFFAGRKLYLLNIDGDDFRVPIGRPNPNIERLRTLAGRKLWATVAPGIWSNTVQQEILQLIQK